ncbi:unnamed protein product [Urochloa humidicola]
MASSKRRSSSSWSGLPPDLLGLVLARLHSLADRIRVGSVCQPWCSGARLHTKLPPPMPWVALGGTTYLDVVNGGTAHRLSLQVPENARCHGSADHLLFLTCASGGCFLADPFTGASLPVADLALFIEEQKREEMFSLTYISKLHVHKVVLLWPPHGFSSEVPIVAALLKYGTEDYKTTIFVCRAGKDTGVTKESYRTMSVDLRLVDDIAFFRGNLYALSKREHDRLLVVELGDGPSGNPVITGVKYVIRSQHGASYDDFESEEEDEMVDFIAFGWFYLGRFVHLVQCGDQLLMLKLRVSEDDGTRSFHVYEADFGSSPCRWKRVRSLGGHALFLGQYCSKSVCVGDGHYGAQKDCIYFVLDDGDSGIYNLRNYKMRPLVPDTDVLERHMRPWIPTWIFPQSVYNL